MSSIKINVTLTEGDNFFVILKIADKVFRIQRSFETILNLPPRIYYMGVTGVQAPDDPDSKVIITVSEGDKIIKHQEITPRQFTQTLRIEVL
jgi:hypothetical protein